MARYLAISNRKGGSGKTTTAVNLSAALAHRGYRVLLVDADPQAHATLSLGITPGNHGGGLYAVVAEQAPIPQVTVDSSLDLLKVVPADQRLSHWEQVHATDRDKRTLLSRRVREHDRSFDFVIFDTPPVVSLLTVSALLASREVYVPMQTHFLALEGLAQIARTVKQINTIYGTGLRLRGVIPTFYRERTRLSKTVVEEVASFLGEEIVLHPIRVSIALAEAPGYGRSVFQHDLKSSGAQDYLILARQIERMENGHGEAD